MAPARTAPAPGWGVGLLLVTAMGFLSAGLVLPAFRVEHFFALTSRDVTILDGIRAFFEDGQIYLGVLVLAVSVIFPIGKILVGLVIASAFAPDRPGVRALIGFLGFLAKWSMTDVFLVALIVLVLDGRLLTTADLRFGIGVFATGVVLSGLGIHRLNALARRATA